MRTSEIVCNLFGKRWFSLTERLRNHSETLLYLLVELDVEKQKVCWTVKTSNVFQVKTQSFKTFVNICLIACKIFILPTHQFFCFFKHQQSFITTFDIFLSSVSSATNAFYVWQSKFCVRKCFKHVRRVRTL